MSKDITLYYSLLRFVDSLTLDESRFLFPFLFQLVCYQIDHTRFINSTFLNDVENTKVVHTIRNARMRYYVILLESMIQCIKYSYYKKSDEFKRTNTKYVEIFNAISKNKSKTFDITATQFSGIRMDFASQLLVPESDVLSPSQFLDRLYTFHVIYELTKPYVGYNEEVEDFSNVVMHRGFLVKRLTSNDNVATLTMGLKDFLVTEKELIIYGDNIDLYFKQCALMLPQYTTLKSNMSTGRYLIKHEEFKDDQPFIYREVTDILLDGIIYVDIRLYRSLKYGNTDVLCYEVTRNRKNYPLVLSDREFVHRTYFVTGDWENISKTRKSDEKNLVEKFDILQNVNQSKRPIEDYGPSELYVYSDNPFIYSPGQGISFSISQKNADKEKEEFAKFTAQQSVNEKDEKTYEGYMSSFYLDYAANKTPSKNDNEYEFLVYSNNPNNSALSWIYDRFRDVSAYASELFNTRDNRTKGFENRRNFLRWIEDVRATRIRQQDFIYVNETGALFPFNIVLPNYYKPDPKYKLSWIELTKKIVKFSLLDRFTVEFLGLRTDPYNRVVIGWNVVAKRTSDDEFRSLDISIREYQEASGCVNFIDLSDKRKFMIAEAITSDNHPYDVVYLTHEVINKSSVRHLTCETLMELRIVAFYNMCFSWLHYGNIVTEYPFETLLYGPTEVIKTDPKQKWYSNLDRRVQVSMVQLNNFIHKELPNALENPDWALPNLLTIYSLLATNSQSVSTNPSKLNEEFNIFFIPFYEGKPLDIEDGKPYEISSDKYVPDKLCLHLSKSPDPTEFLKDSKNLGWYGRLTEKKKEATEKEIKLHVQEKSNTYRCSHHMKYTDILATAHWCIYTILAMPLLNKTTITAQTTYWDDIRLKKDELIKIGLHWKLYTACLLHKQYMDYLTWKSNGYRLPDSNGHHRYRRSPTDIQKAGIHIGQQQTGHKQDGKPENPKQITIEFTGMSIVGGVDDIETGSKLGAISITEPGVSVSLLRSYLLPEVNRHIENLKGQKVTVDEIDISIPGKILRDGDNIINELRNVKPKNSGKNSPVLIYGAQVTINRKKSAPEKQGQGKGTKPKGETLLGKPSFGDVRFKFTIKGELINSIDVNPRLWNAQYAQEVRERISQYLNLWLISINYPKCEPDEIEFRINGELITDTYNLADKIANTKPSEDSDVFVPPIYEVKMYINRKTNPQAEAKTTNKNKKILKLSIRNYELNRIDMNDPQWGTIRDILKYVHHDVNKWLNINFGTTCTLKEMELSVNNKNIETIAQLNDEVAKAKPDSSGAYEAKVSVNTNPAEEKVQSKQGATPVKSTGSTQTKGQDKPTSTPTETKEHESKKPQSKPPPPNVKKSEDVGKGMKVAVKDDITHVPCKQRDYKTETLRAIGLISTELNKKSKALKKNLVFDNGDDKFPVSVFAFLSREHWIDYLIHEAEYIKEVFQNKRKFIILVSLTAVSADVIASMTPTQKQEAKNKGFVTDLMNYKDIPINKPYLVYYDNKTRDILDVKQNAEVFVNIITECENYINDPDKSKPTHTPFILERRFTRDTGKMETTVKLVDTKLLSQDDIEVILQSGEKEIPVERYKVIMEKLKGSKEQKLYTDLVNYIDHKTLSHEVKEQRDRIELYDLLLKALEEKKKKGSDTQKDNEEFTHNSIFLKLTYKILAHRLQNRIETRKMYDDYANGKIDKVERGAMAQLLVLESSILNKRNAELDFLILKRDILNEKEIDSFALKKSEFDEKDITILNLKKQFKGKEIDPVTLKKNGLDEKDLRIFKEHYRDLQTPSIEEQINNRKDTLSPDSVLKYYDKLQPLKGKIKAVIEKERTTNIKIDAAGKELDEKLKKGIIKVDEAVRQRADLNLLRRENEKGVEKMCKSLVNEINDEESGSYSNKDVNLIKSTSVVNPDTRESINEDREKIEERISQLEKEKKEIQERIKERMNQEVTPKVSELQTSLNEKEKDLAKRLMERIDRIQSIKDVLKNSSEESKARILEEMDRLADKLSEKEQYAAKDFISKEKMKLREWKNVSSKDKPEAITAKVKKPTKKQAGYSVVPGDKETLKGVSCFQCQYFDDGKCYLVSGDIRGTDSCNLWTIDNSLDLSYISGAVASSKLSMGKKLTKSEAGYIEPIPREIRQEKGKGFSCASCVMFTPTHSGEGNDDEDGGTCQAISDPVSAYGCCNLHSFKGKPFNSNYSSGIEMAKMIDTFSSVTINGNHISAVKVTDIEDLVHNPESSKLKPKGLKVSNISSNEVKKMKSSESKPTYLQPFGIIPREVLIIIMSFMDLTSMRNLSLCVKAANNVFLDEKFFFGYVKQKLNKRQLDRLAALGRHHIITEEVQLTGRGISQYYVIVDFGSHEYFPYLSCKVRVRIDTHVYIRDIAHANWMKNIKLEGEPTTKDENDPIRWEFYRNRFERDEKNFLATAWGRTDPKMKLYMLFTVIPRDSTVVGVLPSLCFTERILNYILQRVSDNWTVPLFKSNKKRLPNVILAWNETSNGNEPDYIVETSITSEQWNHDLTSLCKGIPPSKGDKHKVCTLFEMEKLGKYLIKQMVFSTDNVIRSKEARYHNLYRFKNLRNIGLFASESEKFDVANYFLYYSLAKSNEKISDNTWRGLATRKLDIGNMTKTLISLYKHEVVEIYLEALKMELPDIIEKVNDERKKRGLTLLGQKKGTTSTTPANKAEENVKKISCKDDPIRRHRTGSQRITRYISPLMIASNELKKKKNGQKEISISPFDIIPYEVFINIMSFMNTSSLYSFSVCMKKANELLIDDAFFDAYVEPKLSVAQRRRIKALGKHHTLTKEQIVPGLGVTKRILHVNFGSHKRFPYFSCNAEVTWNPHVFIYNIAHINWSENVKLEGEPKATDELDPDRIQFYLNALRDTERNFIDKVRHDNSQRSTWLSSDITINVIPNESYDGFGTITPLCFTENVINYLIGWLEDMAMRVRFNWGDLQVPPISLKWSYVKTIESIHSGYSIDAEITDKRWRVSQITPAPIKAHGDVHKIETRFDVALLGNYLIKQMVFRADKIFRNKNTMEVSYHNMEDVMIGSEHEKDCVRNYFIDKIQQYDNNFTENLKRFEAYKKRPNRDDTIRSLFHAHLTLDIAYIQEAKEICEVLFNEPFSRFLNEVNIGRMKTDERPYRYIERNESEMDTGIKSDTESTGTQNKFTNDVTDIANEYIRKLKESDETKPVSHRDIASLIIASNELKKKKTGSPNTNVIHISPFDIIPYEVFIAIMSFMDVPTLGAFSKCMRKANELFLDDTFFNACVEPKLSGSQRTRIKALGKHHTLTKEQVVNGLGVTRRILHVNFGSHKRFPYFSCHAEVTLNPHVFIHNIAHTNWNQKVRLEGEPKVTDELDPMRMQFYLDALNDTEKKYIDKAIDGKFNKSTWLNSEITINVIPDENYSGFGTITPLCFTENAINYLVELLEIIATGGHNNTWKEPQYPPLSLKWSYSKVTGSIHSGYTINTSVAQYRWRRAPFDTPPLKDPADKHEIQTRFEILLLGKFLIKQMVFPNDRIFSWQGTTMDVSYHNMEDVIIGSDYERNCVGNYLIDKIQEYDDDFVKNSKQFDIYKKRPDNYFLDKIKGRDDEYAHEVKKFEMYNKRPEMDRIMGIMFEAHLALDITYIQELKEICEVLFGKKFSEFLSKVNIGRMETGEEPYRYIERNKSGIGKEEKPDTVSTETPNTFINDVTDAANEYIKKLKENDETKPVSSRNNDFRSKHVNNITSLIIASNELKKQKTGSPNTNVIHISPFDIIPYEMLITIMSFMDVSTLGAFSKCMRKANELFLNDIFFATHVRHKLTPNQLLRVNSLGKHHTMTIKEIPELGVSRFEVLVDFDSSYYFPYLSAMVEVTWNPHTYVYKVAHGWWEKGMKNSTKVLKEPTVKNELDPKRIEFYLKREKQLEDTFLKAPRTYSDMTGFGIEINFKVIPRKQGMTAGIVTSLCFTENILEYLVGLAFRKFAIPVVHSNKRLPTVSLKWFNMGPDETVSDYNIDLDITSSHWNSDPMMGMMAGVYLAKRLPHREGEKHQVEPFFQTEKLGKNLIKQIIFKNDNIFNIFTPTPNNSDRSNKLNIRYKGTDIKELASEDIKQFASEAERFCVASYLITYKDNNYNTRVNQIVKENEEGDARIKSKRGEVEEMKERITLLTKLGTDMTVPFEERLKMQTQILESLPTIQKKMSEVKLDIDTISLLKVNSERERLKLVIWIDELKEMCEELFDKKFSEIIDELNIERVKRNMKPYSNTILILKNTNDSTPKHVNTIAPLMIASNQSKQQKTGSRSINAIHVSPFDVIAYEVFIAIMSFMDVPTLGAFSRCMKKANELFLDDKFFLIHVRHKLTPNQLMRVNSLGRHHTMTSVQEIPKLGVSRFDVMVGFGSSINFPYMSASVEVTWNPHAYTYKMAHQFWLNKEKYDGKVVKEPIVENELDPERIEFYLKKNKQNEKEFLQQKEYIRSNNTGFEIGIIFKVIPWQRDMIAGIVTSMCFTEDILEYLVGLAYRQFAVPVLYSNRRSPTVSLKWSYIRPDEIEPDYYIDLDISSTHWNSDPRNQMTANWYLARRETPHPLDKHKVEPFFHTEKLGKDLIKKVIFDSDHIFTFVNNNESLNKISIFHRKGANIFLLASDSERHSVEVYLIVNKMAAYDARRKEIVKEREKINAEIEPLKKSKQKEIDVINERIRELTELTEDTRIPIEERMQIRTQIDQTLPVLQKTVDELKKLKDWHNFLTNLKDPERVKFVIWIEELKEMCEELFDKKFPEIIDELIFTWVKRSKKPFPNNVLSLKNPM